MHFRKHPDLKAPHGSTIVWRYMGLEKFLDLLTHKRLFFTNAINLTDGYEVSLPLNIVKAKRKRLQEKGFAGRDLEEELARFEYNNHPMRDLTLVNCWSLGRHESYALWKIYLGGSKAGVAIRTNFSKLRNSIINVKQSHSENIYAGEVQYRDFLPENELSRFNLVTTKREFYRFEQEVRLFILHHPRSEGGHKPPYNINAGRHVNVDIETLIDEIYLSPFVGEWSGDALKMVVERITPNIASRFTVSSIRDQ